MTLPTAQCVGVVLVLLAGFLMAFDHHLVGYRVPGWYIAMVFGLAMGGIYLIYSPIPVYP